MHKEIVMMWQTDKTKILKAWRSIETVETGTYNSFRPDLKGKAINGEKQIVLFRLEKKNA